MIARAIARYIKIAPRKARLVADAVRGERVDKSLDILAATNKKASELISDVVASAASNAKRKYPDKKYADSDMIISKITVDGGPMLARYRAASMGRASMIRKRTSHILVELSIAPEKSRRDQEAAAKKKTAKPIAVKKAGEPKRRKA